MLTDCKVLVQDLKVCLKGEGRQDPPCLSVGVSQILYSTAGFWAV